MKKAGKIVALILLGLFALSMLASIVSALTIEDFTTSLKNLLKSANLEEFLTRLISPSILFAVLIFLIIFTIVSVLPMIKSASKGIKIAIAVVVAILSSAFISPDIIRPLINQYSALGITVSFVLPFILIFYFIKETVPRNKTIQRVIWIIYFIALAISYIGNRNTLTSPGNLIYWGMAIGAAVMFFYGRTVLDLLWKEELREQLEERTGQAQASLVSQIAYDEERLSQLSGAARTALEAKIVRNRAALERLRLT
jgi:hypothetical protein